MRLAGAHLKAAKLDVEKAFDRLRHSAIVKALKPRQVPDRLIFAIMTEYDQASVRVHLDGMFMAEVELQRGVKQGSPLSAMLFELVTDDIQECLIHTWRLRGFGVPVMAATKNM